MGRRRRILSIVGARPQFVKLAALAPVLQRRWDHTIVHTGQHYDSNMSDIFFDQLGLPDVAVNLRVRKDGHGAMTGEMLIRLEPELQRQSPDLVLVYGDTNTTLAGALAAAKLGIPVGHIEAGLRSHVPDMPEETNRRLTDHMSELLFCPTAKAVSNVRREGIRQRVVLSGDLMYELIASVRKQITSNRHFLKDNGLNSGEFYYVTVHRAASVDARETLGCVLDILAGLDRAVLFPLHPRTRARLRRFRLDGSLLKMPHVNLTNPLGHRDSLTAARYARAVLTDSGGLQKEALFLGTPVLTLRDETEWVETLRRGNRLVGLDVTRVRRAVSRLPHVKPPDFRIDGHKPSRIISSQIHSFFREC